MPLVLHRADLRIGPGPCDAHGERPDRNANCRRPKDSPRGRYYQIDFREQFNLGYRQRD